MHIHEGVAGKSPSGKVIVDIDKYEPIARLGGNFYGRIKEVFELSRPNSQQMRHRVEQLQTQVGQVWHTCVWHSRYCVWRSRPLNHNHNTVIESKSTFFIKLVSRRATDNFSFRLSQRTNLNVAVIWDLVAQWTHIRSLLKPA